MPADVTNLTVRRMGSRQRSLSLAMGPRLSVFTSPFCGMCLVLKKWLAEWQVAYREVDTSSDDRAQLLLRKLANGYLSVPTLVFEDGAVLIEPSREALTAALATRRLMP